MKEELVKLNKGKYVLPIMEKIAQKHNVPFILNDTYTGKCAMIKFPNNPFIIWDLPFNINYSGSVKICMNKDICTSFLHRNGFSVPKSQNYTRRSKEKNIDLYESIMQFIENLEENGFDYPLIIKPATLSQGRGISKIYNKEEAKEIIKNTLNDKELEKNRTFIIQEFANGNDYRIVVLGDKILQAYKRVPFHIVGDGINIIEKLIDDKIKSFIDAQRDKEVDKNDERILNNIKEAGYNLDDILEKGKILKLQNIANLSLGGTSIDCSDTISDYYSQMAIGVAKTLNLDMCGIDIIAQDIENPKNKDYKILEVNSAPGLDNYLYDNSEKQEKYVEYLYEKIFIYLMNKNSVEKEKQEDLGVRRK